jgi:hypothetical protein
VPDSSTGSKHLKTPKSKRGRRGETMKIKGKASMNSSRKSDSYHSSSGTHSHGDSDDDAFDDALLNLSNGSFFDSNDEFSGHKTSESLELLRASLSLGNSSSSFGDSVISFAESEGRTEKERRKKRRGKRGSSVSSERGKPRSKSVDENSKTSSKARRGRRNSKSKAPTFNPNDYKKSSSSSNLYDLESLTFDLPSNHDWFSISRDGEPQMNPSNERGANYHKSPKHVARKSSSNTMGSKQRHSSKSPKLASKKELSEEFGSPRSPTRKKNKRGSSSKSYIPPAPLPQDVDPILEVGPRSDQDFQEFLTPLATRHGLSKLPAKDESNKSEDDFYDLALSSWVERAAEMHVTETPKVKNASIKVEASRKKDPTRKTRWHPEPSPTLNATSLSSETENETDHARVPAFSEIMEEPFAPITQPEPKSQPEPTAQPTPKAKKNLNFLLNFTEYEDISPLTIASKKVGKIDVQLMSALYLAKNN